MGNYWKILAIACAAWGTAVYAQTLLSRRALSGEDRALEFLKTLPREWSGTSDHDCKTYEHKNIDRLSRSFAVSAARFLQAFVEVHGAVAITSAHCTEEEQTCVCVGENGPCAWPPRVVKKT